MVSIWLSREHLDENYDLVRFVKQKELKYCRIVCGCHHNNIRKQSSTLMKCVEQIRCGKIILFYERNNK